MPVVFAGHGSPMNAIEDNRWSRAFGALGRALPEPRAILAVSAHWYVPGTFVTGGERPVTIHDFGGFPQELFDVVYPARGDVALAKRIGSLLAPVPVPVLQLSLDLRLAPAQHVAIGRAGSLSMRAVRFG